MNTSSSDSVSPGSSTSKFPRRNQSISTSSTVFNSPSDHIRFVYDICHEVSSEFLEDFHRGCAQVDPNEPSTELRRRGLEIQQKYPVSQSIINNTRAEAKGDINTEEVKQEESKGKEAVQEETEVYGAEARQEEAKKEKAEDSADADTIKARQEESKWGKR
ncbi:hypothetical protein FLONG3_2177 [Fusarium longipes]|uniref:Uncharacterized protein n=1 Tax=Fusarium longipes TaxID=694270 RepID=A0A395T4R4_9HYPO|nr:hypothetical protein FLONG3_2177 [Fusarium longipes]